MLIYGLVDPEGPELFYVGCTANLRERMRRHRYSPASKHIAKKLSARVQKIRAKGNKLGYVLLELGCDPVRELEWIKFFADLLGLVNTLGLGPDYATHLAKQRLKGRQFSAAANRRRREIESEYVHHIR
jgi:hypothetical protein